MASKKKKNASQDKVERLYSKMISDNQGFKTLLKTAPLTKTERYVPFDVFKQSVELMTSNLVSLGEVIRELNMRTEISINLRFGETELTITGSEENRDYYMEQAQGMLDKMTKTLFGEKKLASDKRAKERDANEQLKSYG